MFDVVSVGAYMALLGLIYLVLVGRRVRKHSRNRGIRNEAVESGMNIPASLHPVVNHSLCVGCEACVHACPEYPNHTVLGLVAGKAELVSPSDCIGHGACKTACPVGAIKLVFGTAERGVDIPAVSPEFETSVPGLFIAGELGGMGLIRNAVEQGRQAMESIISKLKKQSRGNRDSGILDVLIVGAGPAGFSATLTAHEAGLRYVTIEQNSLGGTVACFPRGKLVMTAPARLSIVGPMNFKETSKEALIEFWQRVERDTGINVHYNERMTDIRQGEGFLVETTKNSYRVRSVLLSLGRRGTPRKLDVPGEELPKVVYSLVDPAQYDGQQVLVVGGGDSALEAAHSIADRPGTRVTLSYRSGAFTRAKRKNRDRVEALRQSGVLDVLLESSVVCIGADEVEVETLQGRVRRPNDAVIVCVGGVLATGFLQELGVNVETKYGVA